MGLTEHERKVLQELERGLYQDDQEFANRVSGAAEPKTAKNPASRLIAGALVAVAGVSVLVTGVVLHLVPIGVGGFIFTLAGLVLASSNWSNSALDAKTNKSKAKPKNGPTSFFEDRWERRTGN